MGRKKGKQSSVKADNTRLVSRLTNLKTSENIVREVENSQNWTCEGGEDNGDIVRSKINVNIPSVRTLMEQNRPPNISNKENKKHILNDLDIDRSSLFKITLNKLRSTSLAELCIDEIGKHFSYFDFQDGDTLNNFNISSEDIDRISYVSSYYNQLNNQNVKCLFSHNVNKLTLHSNCLSCIDDILPETIELESLSSNSSSINTFNASTCINNNNDDDNLDNVNNNDDDMDWYHKEEDEIPTFLHHKGCFHLMSLSISSPYMEASFLIRISIHLPLLIKLEYMNTIHTISSNSNSNNTKSINDTDISSSNIINSGVNSNISSNNVGFMSHIIKDSIPNFKKLEYLNLSNNDWFCNELLIELLSLLPLVSYTMKLMFDVSNDKDIIMNQNHQSSSPSVYGNNDMDKITTSKINQEEDKEEIYLKEKTRLKHLACKETGVTEIGIKSALTMLHKESDNAFTDLLVEI